MAVEFINDTAKFTDMVSIEEAEALYNWFLEGGKRKIDLSEVSHIHLACLQLLLIFKPEITALPKQDDLRMFLTEGGK